MEDEVHITRRHLPHWTMKGAAYFVTFRIQSGVLSIQEQKLTLDIIKSGHGSYYTLIAAIVMPNHVHMIFIPYERYTLSRIMKGLKGKSARMINVERKTFGSVWQNESFDRIIRDQKELRKKINYMLNNPIKKELTDDPWNYHGWYYNEEEW